MSLYEFIREDLIKVNLTVDNQDQLFETLFIEAYQRGYVKKEYLQKLKEREAVFPTGLSMGEYSVAIPHTDPEFIINPFIAVATLEKPVAFHLMEDKSKQTEVNMILMLGLNEPHSQLKMLQEIMTLIQDKSKIEQLLKAQTPIEVQEILKKIEAHN
jgi:PTS system galactitol-specific IIA component